MRNIPSLLAKAKQCQPRQVNAISFDVISPSGSTYAVDLKPPAGTTLRSTCTCNWQSWQPGTACTHILAVELLLAKREQVRLSFWFHKADAARQHRATRTLGDLFITIRRYA